VFVRGFQMNDKRSTPKVSPGPMGSPQKLPYAPPALKTYGSVSALTQAKGGTLSDGASGMNMA
jgi:hypothetical protein